MINSRYFLGLACYILVSCASSNNAKESYTTLPAKNLLPYGRSLLTNDQLELISSAVHFGFSFDGKECEIFASLPPWMDHNYLQYELDGVYQKRIKVSKNDKTPIQLTASGDG